MPSMVVLRCPRTPPVHRARVSKVNSLLLDGPRARELITDAKLVGQFDAVIRIIRVSIVADLDQSAAAPG